MRNLEKSRQGTTCKVMNHLSNVEREGTLDLSPLDPQEWLRFCKECTLDEEYLECFNWMENCFLTTVLKI